MEAGQLQIQSYELGPADLVQYLNPELNVSVPPYCRPLLKGFGVDRRQV